MFHKAAQRRQKEHKGAGSTASDNGCWEREGFEFEQQKNKKLDRPRATLGKRPAGANLSPRQE